MSAPHPRSSRSYPSVHKTRIYKPIVLLVPALKPTVLSLPPLPTSAHPTSIGPIGPTTTYLIQADLPSSVDSAPKKLRHLEAAFPSSHTRFPTYVPLAHRAIQPACSPSESPHVFPDPCQCRGGKDTHGGAHFWFVASLCSSLRSFNCTAEERTQNKNPAQYLLTIEQMVEKRYPVP